MPPRAVSRFALSVAIGGLCLLLANRTPAAPLEVAPAPRASQSETDRVLLAEIQARAEIMKNLEYLSDRIGGRLTGSANLEKANKWTAEKMKAYGLENVRLEPWEIPYGWERGRAEMKLIEPDTGRSLLIASRGWAPGTKGKSTADVVLMKNPKTKADLMAFKGKLKGAVVLVSDPAKVNPITDLSYGPPPAPKRDEKREPRPPRPNIEFQEEVLKFLKEEGVACQVSDAGKPHGLLVTTGGWGADRAAAQEGFPRVFMAHEHYALLHRLASRPDAVTRVELEITNKFTPGPLTVFNTIGEVRGSEKPDEIVVVGAHLDSWELATGTTDNGTGSCVVLETARAVAALAKAGQRPKRTIRFCLFTGEEQGLWGSKKYVQKYKDQLPKHSVALIHDTGTGKVTGFGVQGRENILPVLEPELWSLKSVEGWKGLDRGGMGGTDHLPFEKEGVPGFACRQDMDEYRLTHHTQSDTFDKAKEPNLIQGAQVLAVTAVRVANLPELLPRK
jgi:hypothetical protein